MDMGKDYYAILGVSRDASLDDIKKAYRKLAMKYHPDRNPGDPAAEEKFKEITEAYTVLADPEKRAMYDRYGYEGLTRNGGFDFQDFWNSDIFRGFEDIFRFFEEAGFGSIFDFGSRRTRRRRGSSPVPGEDLHHTLEIDLEDAYRGTEIDLTIERMGTCRTCHGSGLAEGGQWVRCPECQGVGEIHTQRSFLVITRTCPTCRGAGEVISQPCSDCHGSGRVMEERLVRIRIPKGVDTGNQIRIRGEGHQGLYGGRPGNLYIIIKVRDHDVFKRQGDDLYVDKDISVFQALLGDEIEIPSLDGDVEKVKIPPGTQYGTILKIAGKGMPNIQGHGYGDMYVRLNVLIPKKLDDEDRVLIEKIARKYHPDIQPTGGRVFSKVRRFFRGEE